MPAAVLCRGPCTLAARRLLCSGTRASLPRAAAPRFRREGFSSRWQASVGGRPLEEQPLPSSDAKWDLSADKGIEFKWTTDDLARFPAEREAFRNEPRLGASSVPDQGVGVSMDFVTTLRGAVSSVRVLGDYYTTIFEDLLYDRIAGRPDLFELFQIPTIEEKSVVQEKHSQAVPQDGAYLRVRRQAYWLAIHMWLWHSKQHAIQEGEGLFVSALCSLLTRRIFEYQWNLIRGLLHAADVPIMSVTNELQDMQEFVFGFCLALDTAFREEAPRGCVHALALAESDLADGNIGLAPRVKYVLWSNVYSGAIDHDASELHELTVYFLRQRMLMEKLPRDAFLSCRFAWAEHPLRQ